jgi:NAD kinase
MALPPRVVVVQRRTEYEELVARHSTRQQVGFFLAQRDRTLDEVQQRHAAQQEAAQQVFAAIPLDWRRGEVERDDLSRFVFGPEDVIVAVGQDGLVANVAKYLRGQIVVGINPEPERNPGVLVRHAPGAVEALLPLAVEPTADTVIQSRVMVSATLDDGQSLSALNEVYVGHRSHQSARYLLRTPKGATERHSSSGVLVGTGTGATGWCRSAWQERKSPVELPTPEQASLCWFVREAWPSPATGTERTQGLVRDNQTLAITAESDLVIFGDGIEGDALSLTWGQTARIGVAATRLRLLA